jgi:hypothetical protein
VLDELMALGALDAAQALEVGRRVLGGNAARIYGCPAALTSARASCPKMPLRIFARRCLI